MCPTQDPDGWLAAWMESLANKVRTGLVIEGHKVTTQRGPGPLVYVTVRGAAKDSAAAQTAREQLEPLLARSLAAEVGDSAGFETRIASHNRGADLFMECEIVFPKG